MLTVVVLGLSFVAGGGGAGADPVGPASIEELVRMYRSGRREEAASLATRWSDEQITHEVGRLLAEDAARKKTEEREVVVLPTLDIVGLEGHASSEKAEERERRRLAAAAILEESALRRFRDGDRRLLAPGMSTASRLLEAEPLGASAPDAPFDPWWSYGAGQPDRFDGLVAQLRELVE
jgi:hypothetical protein